MNCVWTCRNKERFPALPQAFLPVPCLETGASLSLPQGVLTRHCVCGGWIQDTATLVAITILPTLAAITEAILPFRPDSDCHYPTFSSGKRRKDVGCGRTGGQGLLKTHLSAPISHMSKAAFNRPARPRSGCVEACAAARHSVLGSRSTEVVGIERRAV